MKKIINNGESGLVVRNKLNDNFTELYTPTEYTTAERNNLSVGNGYRIYNTDTNQIEVYQNGDWLGLNDYQKLNEKGIANGYASLDSSGKVPASQLPSYVDDVIEVADYASLPNPGETGKIYITLDDNLSYRWSGSAYFCLNKSTIYKTVGTNGDYPTLTDAIANRQANLILISDVIEIADLSIDYKLNINLNSHTLDMTTFNFQGTAESYYIENGIINFSYDIAKNLIEKTTELYNVTINNNSTINNARIVETSILYARKCIFNLPNVQNSGFGENNDFIGSLIDCEINGGGNNTGFILFENFNSKEKIENLKINAQGAIALQSPKALHIGIVITNSNSTLILTSEVMANNIWTAGNIRCDSKASANGFYAKSIASAGGKFINGEFTNSVTDNYSGTTYRDIIFDSDVTIQGDNITLDNCRIDNGTINIDATADGTKIIGCRTATPIVDNGTNTEII